MSPNAQRGDNAMLILKPTLFFSGEGRPLLWRDKIKMTSPRTSSFDSGNGMPDPIAPTRVRIITLGDVGTGKSCLIKRYCEPSRFASKSVPTIGVDYGTRACGVRSGGGCGQIEAKMDFFDLSGEGVCREGSI